MIWWLLGIGVCYLLVRFFLAYTKDTDDLQGQTLADKFAVVVASLNEVAFDGYGSVTNLDKRAFNLYQEGQNQIIKFQYGTGHLTITWKYKYFQKEIVHERQFTNVRNLGIFEQQKMADLMVREMSVIVENHKNSVIGGIL